MSAQADHTAQQEFALKVLGPLVTSAFLSCGACGVVVCLACLYFARFPNDRWVFKVLVGVLTVVIIADTACEASYAFDWAVRDWDGDMHAGAIRWQAWMYCIFGIPVCVVQLWFGWRVWVMSGRGNYILVGLITLGSLGALGCIFRSAEYLSKHALFSAFSGVRSTILAWVALCFGVDVLLTGGILWYLWLKPRKEGGSNFRSDSRIVSLALIALKTNSLALAIQIVIVILLLAYPGNMHWGTPVFLESKVYLGSLIATLNVRDPALQSTSAPDSLEPPHWLTSPSDFVTTGAPRSNSEADHVSLYVLRNEDRDIERGLADPNPALLHPHTTLARERSSERHPSVFAPPPRARPAKDDGGKVVVSRCGEDSEEEDRKG
ncbi:hypothetical protein JCM10207_003792 [Rhodosporidiobolus poonsookiae]